MAPLRVTFLVPYPPGCSPGQRFRFEQWLRLLPEGAVEADIRPLLRPAAFARLYEPGGTPRKAAQTTAALARRLVQADRMGTPLGKVLRVLSTQMRNERTQRAEKLANEAPVKLVLPLVFFIFPTLFLVLFGPIGYQVFFGGSF